MLPEASQIWASTGAAIGHAIVERYRSAATVNSESVDNRRPRSLDKLSVRLGAVGRREEALTASAEAAEIRRRLADQHSDAFLPDLATTLYNRSVTLGVVGRQEEARSSITEAIEVRRRLAEQRPDAHAAELAVSQQVRD